GQRSRFGNGAAALAGLGRDPIQADLQVVDPDADRPADEVQLLDPAREGPGMTLGNELLARLGSADTTALGEGRHAGVAGGNAEGLEDRGTVSGDGELRHARGRACLVREELVVKRS